jgi:hypothetical protein
MKAGWKLFSGLAIFYFMMAAIYWGVGGEALGITAIFLSGGLAALVGFYLWFISKRTGGILPEDNLQGEIADSAGEIGFFPAKSWWPLPLSLSACAAGMGLIIGWWLTAIAVGALILSIMGFVLEFERPATAPAGH